MSWSNGLCGCCSVHDCGPMCCIAEYCCGPCVWGSIMEEGGLGSCAMCCVAIYCCPYCTVIKAGMDTAQKYGIQESPVNAVCKGCCCTCCYALQIQSEIMSKENLKYGIINVSKAGAPTNAEMER